MVRTVKDKYNVWLTGYYDDFTGARAIAEDTNTPSNIYTYKHYLSHYGNPLNGEATLNPRYRWCIMDRVRENNTVPSVSFFSSATDKLLHNKGLFEWLSFDPIRNSPNTQQGRAQLQYPDGNTNVNKFRTNANSTSGIYFSDAYQLFCNGNDTSTRYIVPTGDIDASYARNTMNQFINSSNFTDKVTGLNNIGSPTEINTVTRAHLAGHWMGETVSYGADDTAPENVFATVESPSGQPFLCVQRFDKTGSNSTPNEPSLIFDGKLNSRDTGDWLHFRLAVRSFNGATSSNGLVVPKITIKAGFSGTVATNLEDGLTGTPVISFDLDLTGYNTHPMLYDASRTASTVPTTDNMWIDVDVHIDYTSGAQKFKVYQDGVLKSTNNFPLTRVANDMYGWEIYTHAPLNSDNVTTTLMVDRAALYRPLTDNILVNDDINPMESLSLTMVNNGISSAELTFNDEPRYHSDNQYGFNKSQYDQHFFPLFSGSSLKEWKMIVFAGAGETGSKDIARIDSPIWQGIINNVNIDENLQDRKISIEATDTLSILGKQLPLWEQGQGGLSTDESTTLYWSYEAQGMKELMDMGSANLKLLSGNLGHEFSDSYGARSDQRMQMHSSHPIQLYNNEDTHGPNDLENDFEGMGIDYIYKQTDGKLVFVLTGNPGFSANDDVTIKHTGISDYDNQTLEIDSVGTLSTVSGTVQTILFKGNSTANLSNHTLDNDSVITNPNSIVYAGKYIGIQPLASDTSYLNNESLGNNTTLSITDIERNNTWREMVHRHPCRGYVESITVLTPGQNYTSVVGYGSSMSNPDRYEPSGEIDVPTPQETFSASGASGSYVVPTSLCMLNVSSRAIATYHINTIGVGTVESVTIEDGGYGYDSAPAVTSANLKCQVNGNPSNGANRTGGVKSFTMHTNRSDFENTGDIQASHFIKNQTSTHHSNGNVGNGTGIRISYDVASGAVVLGSILVTQDNTENYFHGKGYVVGDTITFTHPTTGSGNQFFKLNVSALIDDATFEVHIANEPFTDYLTLCMDVDPNLTIGDEFVYNNTKHLVKNALKIYNYHSTGIGVVQSNGLRADAVAPYLWQIQTHTRCEGDFASEQGDWLVNDGLLSGSNRKNWGYSIGGVITPKPTSQTEDVSNRVSHAVWMRDMPKSLWFQYHFGQIKSESVAQCLVQSTIEPTHTTIEVTSNFYSDLPNHGVGQIRREVAGQNYKNKNFINDFFIYRNIFYDSTADKYYLGGVKYISTKHNATNGGVWTDALNRGDGYSTIHVLDIENDYKHIWLLWADMRNDGTADADGSTRKKSFGIQHPKGKNYKLNLLFEDQFDENGHPVTFTQLKESTDFDMWEIDTTIDSSSGAPFSYPVDYTNQQLAENTGSTNILLDENGSTTANGTLRVRVKKSNHGLATNSYVFVWNAARSGHNGLFKIIDGSNADYFILDNIYLGTDIGIDAAKIKYAPTYGSSSDLTQYRDWETKGGSLIIIDTSKFFNLNTLGNNGSVFQEVGGTTNLIDYVAIGKGDVALIDNYYQYAPSSIISTGNNYKKHKNMNKLLTRSSEYTQDLKKGKFWLEPNDLSQFDYNGLGKISGLSENSVTSFYYTWIGKRPTDLSGAFESYTTPVAGHKHWVLVDNDATFVSNNISVGMYIKNISKPLIPGVGNSYKTNFVQDFYYRIKNVVNETTLWVERVAYLPSNIQVSERFLASNNSILIDESFPDYVQGLRPQILNNNIITDGWSATSNYTIPAQLSNVVLDSATNITTDTTFTPSKIEAEFSAHVNRINSFTDIYTPYIRVNMDNSSFVDVVIYANTASSFAFRLLMNIEGKIKNVNGGTFYSSDKIRTLWNAGLASTWWTQTQMSNMYDINNVPITTLMTSYNDINNNDSYGSLLDTQSKTLLNTIKTMQESTGQGQTNDISTSFSYLIGRDNKIEFRPKYNSGHSISRNGINVSSMSIQTNNIINNVRIYYNNNSSSFVDWPKPNLSDATSWHIETHNEITTEFEALLIAKEIYRRKSKNNISLSVSPIRAAGDSDAMLDGGRFGYVSDAQIAFQGHDDQSKASAWCWTRHGTGGVLFSGMTNALDGNLGAISDKHNRVGISAPLNTTSTIAAVNNYYWYGSKSISKALQIVHVGKDSPKASATTGEKLRMFVAIKTGQAATTSVNDLQFTVFLADYTFATAANDGTTSYNPSNKAPRLHASLATNGSSSKDVKHSGFYELDLPTSYGTGKIVFSFNADYCRDLLRSRCGSSNLEQNANALAGLSLGSSFNTNSIFPLGGKKHPEILDGFGTYRTEWYAPQLHIVNGLTYIPATYVSYTDASHSLDNEILVIQNIEWKIMAGDVEKLSLQLERDESRSATGVVPYILDNLPTTSYEEHHVVDIPVLPPSEAITEDIEGIDIQPMIGNSPPSGVISDGYWQGLDINLLNQGLYGTIWGSMSMGASALTPQTGFNILGQDRNDARTPTSMRGVTSNNLARPISGSALNSNNGFALPGKGKTIDPSETDDNEKSIFNIRETTHSVQLNIPVPNDAMTNELNITGIVDLQASNTSGGQRAMIDIEIKCLESQTTVNHSCTVTSGRNNNIELLPTHNITGITTPGNNLEINISRTPGKGADSAPYSTVNVSNLNVNFRRAGVTGDSNSNEFIPYS
tara:strand:- start:7272 stop:15179 length:7908 start_codon:yes stop_codon:yes gene_type:complete